MKDDLEFGVGTNFWVQEIKHDGYRSLRCGHSGKQVGRVANDDA